MTLGLLARLAWMRARREPASVISSCIGPALAISLALLSLGIADAVWVRAELFVGTSHSSAQRLLVSQRAPTLSAFVWGASEAPSMDARDTERLARIAGVLDAQAVTSLPIATSVVGGESLLERALTIDVLVEGLPPPLVEVEPFVGRRDADARVPAVVHPQLLALYNATVAPNLRLPLLSPAALTGQSATLWVGRGRLASRQPAAHPLSVPLVVVGLSPLASPLGLSLPAADVDVLWRQATGGRSKPPIKGVWLTLWPGASPLEVAREVQRLGLVVDEQTERGARALALGRRLAAWGAWAVWLAVSAGNAQREWLLLEHKAQLTNLLRWWGATPRQLAASEISLMMLRALAATLGGALSAQAALSVLSWGLVAVGSPLGIDVVALGPALRVRASWALAAWAATVALSMVTLFAASRRKTGSFGRAVC